MSCAFEILQPDHLAGAQQIAGWYERQWQMPVATTLEKLQRVARSRSEFHVLMRVDGIPVATGGLHHHVGLLDRVPRLRAHTHWLALVFTVPEYRNRGYGAQLCQYIVQHAADRGITEIHLFTDTAEALYRQLGWEAVERIQVGNRQVVVMVKRMTGTR